MNFELNILEEFKPIDTREWEQQIIKELKGADYEKVIWKTIDNIKINPFYRLENVENLNNYKSLYIPIHRTSKLENNNWLIYEYILLDELELNNKEISNALANNVDGINFFSYNENDFEKIIKSIDDLDNLLKNNNLKNITLTFNSNIKIYNLIVLLEKYFNKNDIDLKPSSINFDYSPLDNLIFKGDFIESEENIYNKFYSLFKQIKTIFPNSRFIGINTYKLNDCGITSSQEVALALSIAVEYLHNLTEKGLNASEIVNSFIFNLGVNANFFFEIAKLRTFRLLWSQIIQKYNIDPTIYLPHIHCINTLWNKSILDPYVNILRTTIEAMAAVFGGANSITLRPFDIIYRKPDEFSMNITRNIQHILKEEAHFDKIIDPVGGSYYIEILTQHIAENAWQIFLNIEDEGGFTEAFKKGHIQNIINEVQQERIKNISSRKEILVGVNQYPDLKEKKLLHLDENHYQKFNCSNDIKKYKYIPVKVFRIAQELEQIRLETSKLPQPPKVYLLKYGNLVMRNARAGFSTNFFGCAGYEIIEGNGFNDISKAIEEAKSVKPDLIVICSSDEEYPVIVPEIINKLKDLYILVLAGYPKEYVDKFNELGLTNFIHIKSNIIETLKSYNKILFEKLNYKIFS